MQTLQDFNRWSFGYYQGQPQYQKMKVKGETVQAGEHYKRMDRRTDRCYQVHNLPAKISYAVDNLYML